VMHGEHAATVINITRLGVSHSTNALRARQ
jgi:hypothetical protein